MDPDSPASRLERTFWTVWYYVADAVNRFLRTEPSSTDSKDQEPPLQQPAADREPAGGVDPEGDSGGRGVDGEQRPATVTLLSSLRPVVAWELCDTDIDLGPERANERGQSQLSGDAESKVSGEQVGQTGNAEAGLLAFKVARAEEAKVSENGDRNSSTHGQRDAPENDEDDKPAKMGPLNLIDNAEEEEEEDSEGSGRKICPEEETEGAVTPDDEHKVGDTARITRVTQDEGDLEPVDTELTLCPLTESSSEVKHRVCMGEARLQMDVVATREEEVDAGSDLASENKNEGDERVENQRSACEDLSEHGLTSLENDFKMAVEKSGKGSEDAEEERVVAVREAADNQALNEAPGEEDTETVAEKNGDVFIEHVACSERLLRNTEGELPAAEFSAKETEVVAEDTSQVQTQTREADDAHGSVIPETPRVPTDISVQEGLFDNNRVAEESFPSGERDGQGSHIEIACTTASVTVTPKGETAQEIRGDWESIPPGVCEGRAAESRELSCPTREETRVRVPGHDNEPGPEENPTQGYGYREGTHATPLPEEVGSQGWESHTGGDFTGDTERELLRLRGAEWPAEGARHSPEDETLSNSSVKTETEHSEEKLETRGTDEMRIGLQYGSGVDVEIGQGPSGIRDAAGAKSTDGFTDETLKTLKSEEGTAEKSFFRESVDALTSEQNSSLTPSLEGVAESRVAKAPGEDEPKLAEDGVVDLHAAGRGAQETPYGVTDEEVEDEMRDRDEMEAFSLEGAEDSPTMRSQPSFFDASEEEMVRGAEAAGDLTAAAREPKDATISAAGESETEGNCATKNVDGSLYVIDEEMFNVWMETALSKDNVGAEKQDGRETAQQMDGEIEPSKEEQEEMPSARAKEKPGDWMSGESGLLSDSEISSSTAESELWDLSVGEWGTEHSETQPVRSTRTGSPQGLRETLGGVPEWAAISRPSPQPPKTDAQEASEYESMTEAEFRPDSGIESSDAGCVIQEPEETREEKDEAGSPPVESETGSRTEITADVTNRALTADWRDPGDAVGEKNKVLSKDDHTEVGDAPLEVAVSGFSDEIAHAESGQSGCGSEAWFQEETMPAESQVDTFTDAEKLTKVSSAEEPQATAWSEDISEVAEEQTTTDSEDHSEVDASALDFTPQRSRIAVKNPRVRPPTDPRSLLNMPSVEPTPSSPLPVRVPKGVPLGGMGIGIKLPGLGAGFPVLKKTRRADKNSETLSQDPETKTEEKSDSPKKDDALHKPRWMPPKHPGFGNPLMSELKTKLKKATEE